MTARVDVEVSAACRCRKCRILRAIGEDETDLQEAMEALGRVVAILTASLTREQANAAKAVFAIACLSQLAAQRAVRPGFVAEAETPPAPPTAH